MSDAIHSLFRIAYPAELPISARRDEVVDLLRRHRVLVLTGETGSGKTTQLPKMLLEAGCSDRGLIAVTQPRRVAAVAMANRLREELAAPEGTVVHSVRFDDRAGPSTMLRVMTDGLLLAEAAKDPLLSRYGAVMVDEAHERSLNIDLLIGLLKRLLREREDLTVVVSSATIAAERFADFLAQDDAGLPLREVPVVAVEGRMYPVEVIYRPPGDDDTGYLDAAIQTIREIHATNPEGGDILAFFPTERDILEASRRLADLRGAACLPLFGRLTPHEQQRIFLPARGRKVVLSTNLAETSLTIPGIRFVVDTGLARLKRYQAATRTERLPIEAVSQASTRQRAGRAGRVEAGVCIRLYAEDDFAARESFTPPEILRSNLAGVALSCLGMGIPDPAAFPWLDPPGVGAWQKGFELLEELGAVEGQGLTGLGRTLAALPADPQVARILLAGLTEGCAHEACTLAAFLSVQDPRVRPLGKEAQADAAQRGLMHEAGDLATVLRLWQRWDEASASRKRRLCDELYLGFRRMREWADVRHQLWQALREGPRGRSLPAHGAPAEEWPLDRIHRAVLAGMLGNVLLFDPEKGCWRAPGDREVQIHPGSALRERKEEGRTPAAKKPTKAAPARWLVACELVETSRLFARLCAPIDPRWIEELAGDRLRRRHRDPHWAPERQQVVVRETLLWKGLPLRDRLVPFERIDPVQAGRIFVRQGLCGDQPPNLPVIERNRAIFSVAQRLRHRLRDGGLWIEAEQLEAWYIARLAEPIATTDRLRTWLKEHGEEALRLQLEDLVPPEAARRAEEGAPEWVQMGGTRFRLAYLLAPGAEDDGATLELDEARIGDLEPRRLDWLVPAWCEETVLALLEQLPKDARRCLIPLAGTAKELAAAIRHEAGQRPLCDALIRILAERHRLRASFDPRALPPHLRLRYLLRDRQGAIAYAGRDPAFLAERAGGGGDRLSLLRLQWESEPDCAWPGDCPGRVEHLGVEAWVGLGRCRSRTGTPALRRTVYGSCQAWEAWHADGLAAGLEAALSGELAALATRPVPTTLAADQQLGERPGVLRRHLALGAALESVTHRVNDEAAWQAAVETARQALTAAAEEIDPLLQKASGLAAELRLRLRQGTRSLAGAQAMRSGADHLALLLGPGWAQQLPWSAARRLPLYLEALRRRLDGTAPPGRETRIAMVLALWEEYRPPDSRWSSALGLGRRLRQLAGEREECALALVGAGGGTAAERALLSFRRGLEEVAEVVAEAQARAAEARQRLLEARPLLGRITTEARRTALTHELDALLKRLPDLSLGCDLATQYDEAARMVERVRGSL